MTEFLTNYINNKYIIISAIGEALEGDDGTEDDEGVPTSVRGVGVKGSDRDNRRVARISRLFPNVWDGGRFPLDLVIVSSLTRTAQVFKNILYYNVTCFFALLIHNVPFPPNSYLSRRLRSSPWEFQPPQREMNSARSFQEKSCDAATPRSSRAKVCESASRGTHAMDDAQFLNCDMIIRPLTGATSPPGVTACLKRKRASSTSVRAG